MSELNKQLTEMVMELQQTGAVANSARFAQDFTDACFNASYASGWWTDIKTGEDLPCDVDLKMSLVHSEISEALEGARKNLMDDKLPHRTMLEVEIADVAIRLGDLVGRIEKEIGIKGLFSVALATEMEGMLASQLIGTLPNDLNRMHYYASRLHMLVVNHTGSWGDYLEKLATLFFVIIETCAYYNLDLGGAVTEKMAFNANRADHKIANRARGGAGDKTF